MKKINKILLCVVLVISFGLLIYCVYDLTLSNKNIMLSIIGENYDDALIDDDFLVNYNNFYLNNITTIKSSNTENKISTNLYKDSNTSTIYFASKITENQMSYNFEGYLNNNNFYYRFKELSGVFSKISNSNSMLNLKYSEDDIEEFEEIIYDVFYNSFSKKLFTKEKVSYNNKKMNSYKFNVTKKSFILFLNNIYKYNNKNTILNNLKASFLNKNNISKVEDYLNKSFDDDSILTYTIFVDKKQIVKEILTLNLFNNLKVVREEYSQNDLVYEKYDVSINNYNDYFLLSLKETSNDVYEIETVPSRLININIKGTININDNNIDGIFIIDNDSKKTISIKEYKESNNIKINFDYINNDNYIKSYSEITSVFNMPNIDISNYNDSAFDDLLNIFNNN